MERLYKYYMYSTQKLSFTFKKGTQYFNFSAKAGQKDTEKTH